MTEQMDHRAAIVWAVRIVSESTQVVFPDKQSVNAARHILHSIKAAWPGVVPSEGNPELLLRAGPQAIWFGHSLEQVQWCNRANKFERDYPGLKVDEPWLQEVLK